jgi:hypothetical protein
MEAVNVAMIMGGVALGIAGVACLIAWWVLS